jgi:DNA repair exonuclease SbcCD ATPase subunit
MTGDWLSAGMGAISGVMSIASTLGQAHDKKKERQIEREMKLVKNLNKIYEELGETIRNAYSLDTLNEATQMSRDNLLEQINATERMIEAEKDKKGTDWDRIEEWEDQIKEYEKSLQELEETRLQELGAFASDESKKSGAQAFMDAWLEAYKETGDGLSGLNEQFDEFFEDMIKKQMLQRGSQKFLEPFFSQFDTAIEDWASGKISDKEALGAIDEAQEYYLPQLNEFWTKLAESLGLSEDLAKSTAELGGLSAGISGITEDQADILAAYWSSVRLYTADTNTKVTELVTKLFSDDATANPMLSQLKAILAQTTAIRDLFDSVVGHGNGGTHSGAYLKVAVG